MGSIIHAFPGAGSSGASALSDLTDVTLSSLSDGNILSYSGSSAKWVNISLGTAASANTTNSITQGSTDVPTAGAVWSAIDNLPEPMILKGTLGTGGTITTLPTASADNEGFTYKVIEAGTYASQAAKVGDFFVSCKPVGASEYLWVWFPSGDESFTDTWRNIKVNGTEQLGAGISTGAVDFVNGTNTTVAFDASGNKISVSVPAVSSTSAGVAPQGAAVSSQSQSTKFLREDGSWAAPSYTTNTDTSVTSVTNHYTPVKSTTKSASGGTLTDIANSSTGSQVVTGIEMDAAGHVTGVTSLALKATNSTYNFGGTTFYSGDASNAGHDCNSITNNGHYYYTSNGPGTDIGATTADGALYAEAYSTSWVGQIAQDYRDGDIFVRGKNNGTWYPWKQLMSFEEGFGVLCTATKFKFNPMTRKIIANKSTSAWDAQVYTSQGYVTNCAVTFKASQINMAIMFGLDNNPTQDANYNTIDYCWYLQNNAGLSIYENGTAISSISGHQAYAANDEFRIEYTGGTVRYYHNGVLCRSVARAISGKLYVDSSFHGASGAVHDFMFYPVGMDSSSVNGLTPSLVT